MKKTLRRLGRRFAVVTVLTLLAVIAIFVLAPSKPAVAANPGTISFQGKVVNANGTNVTDGSYTFVFRLYQNVNINTYNPNTLVCSADTNCWWEETDTVTVTSGTFQVALGATCALTSACNSGHSGIDFNSQNALSLTMKFNSDAAGYMAPLIAMQSVPYALNSDKLGGLTSSGFIQNNAGSAQTSSSFHIDGTGIADVKLQAPSFDTATSNGALGIGSANAGVITIGNVTNSTFILNLKNSSATALQAKNGSGNELLTIDTSANNIALGKKGAAGINGSLVFNTTNASNTTVTIVAASTGTSYSLTLPTTGPAVSQCLQTDSVTASQLKFASCSGGTTDLQAAYVASSSPATITTTASTKDIIFKSGLTFDSSSLFQIQNAAGTSTILNADTINSRIGINSFNALTNLDVGGNTSIGGNSQNLLQYSEQLDNGVWVGSNFTVAANNATAPNGTATADTITTTNVLHSPQQSINVNPSTTYTYSWYAKAGTMSATKYSVYDNTNSSYLVAATSYTVTGSWQRFSASFTTLSNTISIAVSPLRDSGVTGTEILWGQQVVSGASAGTYTLTAGSTVSTGAIALNVQGGTSINAIGSNNILQLQQDGKTVVNVGTNGTATFSNSTNSTTAFQVQSAAGGSLLNIDSTNANITLNGLNNGELQTWNSTTNTLQTRTFPGVTTYNGYIYNIGGLDSGGTGVNNGQYAKLNSDGTTGAYVSVTTLPDNRSSAGVVAVNGYLYLIGGKNAPGTAQSTVYYAKINADGSLGVWLTNPTPLFEILYGMATATSNGNIYIIGGNNGSTTRSLTYSGHVNADGTVSAWAAGSSIGSTRQYASATMGTNGYLYVIGGESPAGTPANTVYYIKPNNTNNTLTGGWTSSGAVLTTALTMGGAVSQNGYLYYIGGSNNSTTNVQSTVYYTALNSDGTYAASWTTSGFPLTNARRGLGVAVNNGYIYAVAGSDGTTATQTVYYASTSRIKLGGSLDLVGAANQNGLGDGNGGSLTAGNTNIQGSLQVRGTSVFANSVSIARDFNVGGSALFQNQSDSTTAFQIQNSTGSTLFGVNTSASNTNNTVANSSFESAISNWTAVGTGTASQSAAQAYEDSNSLLIASGATEGGASYSTGATTFLSTNTTYTLSAFIKTDSSTLIHIDMGDEEATGTLIPCLTNQSLPTNGGWQRFTCTWTTSGSTPTNSFIYFKQTSTDPAVTKNIYVDDVLLQTDANSQTIYRNGSISLSGSMIASPVVLQSSSNSSNALQVNNAAGTQIFNIDTTDTNLISNPGFEVNTSGWSALASTTIRRDTTKTYTGSSSLLITIAGVTTGGASFSLNPVVTAASTTYVISWYSMQVSGVAPTFQATYDPTGAAATTCNPAGANITTGWTRFSCTISSATTPTTGGLIKIAQTNSSISTWNIDGVQMEAASVATPYGAGAISFNGIINSPVNFQNKNDSATAFQIENASSANMFTVDTANTKVSIGSNTTDATQVLFQQDSYASFSDTVTCSTTTNQGATYYNTVMNSVRGCVDGGWQDMVPSGLLGLQLFGIVPDSGSGGNNGDLAGVTALTAGPCKVSEGGTTATVSWTGCTAFSGGRKVIVTAGTALMSSGTAVNLWQHLCLTAANNQPTLSTIGTEVANLSTLSMPGTTNPILCLADIKGTNGSTVITGIYNTATYTNTVKEFASAITTAPALGMAVKSGTTTPGSVTITTATTETKIIGVIVATTGATSTNTINAIIALNGPAWVKSITGTNAVGDFLIGTATGGYANTAAFTSANGYTTLGMARTAWTAACAINSLGCNSSILINVAPR